MTLFFMQVNKQYYKYWKDLWSMQTEEVLDATALIRVIECTNGCVQYAFRDGDERALPIEQSRECMKLSMGTIKNKVLPLPDGTEIVLPKECHEIMNAARDLYTSVDLKKVMKKHLKNFLLFLRHTLK